MSRSPVRLLLYCKITFGNIWLGIRISIHFILKTEEKEEVNMLVRYYLIVNPLVTMVINLGVHLPDRSGVWPWPAR